MTLFDKSLKSFFTSAATSSLTNTKPPSILISDVSVLPASPIVSHIVHKSLAELDKFTHIFLISAQSSFSLDVLGLDKYSNDITLIKPPSSIEKLHYKDDVIEYVTTDSTFSSGNILSFYQHILSTMQQTYNEYQSNLSNNGKKFSSLCFHLCYIFYPLFSKRYTYV